MGNNINLQEMNVNERISYYIRKYRKENNLTQKDLADLLFVQPQTVSAWERGIKTPSTDSISNLISLLGISADLIYKYDTHKVMNNRKKLATTTK